MPNPDPNSAGLFAAPPQQRSFPTTAVVIAAVAIAVLVSVLVLLGRRAPAPPPNTLLPAAAYGNNLQVTDIQMSQSTSLSGGTSTYLDGHIKNQGPATITGVTLQAVFATDAGTAPQIVTVPLTLIRTRQPYVDTEPLSAAPLAPGGEADFRLIFDDVHDGWNQQPPQLRAVAVTTR